VSIGPVRSAFKVAEFLVLAVEGVRPWTVYWEERRQILPPPHLR
jgi:hypothetical protein